MRAILNNKFFVCALKRRARPVRAAWLSRHKARRPVGLAVAYGDRCSANCNQRGVTRLRRAQPRRKAERPPAVEAKLNRRRRITRPQGV
ncbi:MAG: hypothetical protein C0472_00735 [Erythrobacter sp.]|nr:hypothetical protein [Erythrobacter sp.]